MKLFLELMQEHMYVSMGEPYSPDVAQVDEGFQRSDRKRYTSTPPHLPKVGQICSKDEKSK